MSQQIGAIKAVIDAKIAHKPLPYWD